MSVKKTSNMPANISALISQVPMSVVVKMVFAGWARTVLILMSAGQGCVMDSV
jgi:hypothetical protein